MLAYPTVLKANYIEAYTGTKVQATKVLGSIFNALEELWYNLCLGLSFTRFKCLGSWEPTVWASFLLLHNLVKAQEVGSPSLWNIQIFRLTIGAIRLEKKDTNLTVK